jgi:sphingolipid delta-4 desaturase
MQQCIKRTNDLTEGLSDPEHDKFLWSYTEEPHRTRRQAIIKTHPEVMLTEPIPNTVTAIDQFGQVTKLCGPEPLTKYLVIAVVGLQLLCAYLLRNSPIFSPPFLLTAYIIGATANQNLFLAIHEISHNLAFKSPTANRVFAVFANLPIAIPYSAAFRVRALHWPPQRLTNPR